MVTLTRFLRASWSSTLKLPKSAFPARPSAAEQATHLARCRDELYGWQSATRQHKPAFVLHDGPPYANGDLHIGHALNKILKDIICRFQLSRGQRVQYIPGWDCHGLPIEVKALAGRSPVEGGKAEAASAETDHRKIEAMEVRRRARKLAMDAVEKQKDGFKGWGVMGDWEHAYRTMDKGFELRQLGIFKDMVEKGLIYRQKKPVYWSPSSGTALAEAELEYDDNHKSTAAFIRFPIVKPPSGLVNLLQAKQLSSEGQEPDLGAVIWTTTPWTLPANKAIAVHKDMDYVLLKADWKTHGKPDLGSLVVAKERVQYVLEQLQVPDAQVLLEFKGSDLVSQEAEGRGTYKNPLRSEEDQRSPIIHADFVSASSGSGLVHCAPGHGMDDYNVCQAKSGAFPDLKEAFAPVDDQGRFTQEAFPKDPSALEGKVVNSDGSNAVLELLEDVSRNMEGRSYVLAIQEYTHKYPIDWRTKKPVIVRATAQWFADVETIKSAALSSLRHVKFIPKTGRERLESFVKGRSQWCISRQRAWGVPIPALYHKDTGEAVMTTETISHIIRVVDERGTDAWWSDAPDEPAWIPSNLDGPYVRGKDTMDVWFDSGTSWGLLQARDPDQPPIADVYLEGTDQHRGWFQSSLLTYIAHQFAKGVPVNDIMPPFRTLITHGFTLDHTGRKMSKSLGNVVSPDEITSGSLVAPLKPPKKSKSKEPTKDALGADALRLWVASSDYTKDVSLGSTVLQTVNNSLHKYRITFKWLLGVLQDYKNPETHPSWEPHLLIDRLACYQLSNCTQTVYKAYEDYEFHQGVNSLNAYINGDLSAFYFETLKDRLYTGDEADRRAACAVLLRIFDNLLCMLAPITPLLVEEVWQYTPIHIQEAVSHPLERTWAPLEAPKDSPELIEKLEVIRELNSSIKLAQENARKDKKIGSGLECDVHLLVSEKFLQEHRDLLKAGMEEQLANIFVVSNVRVVRDESGEEKGVPDLQQHVPDAAWSYREPIGTAGFGYALVVPAAKSKCPRCWRFVAPEPETLCGRCDSVVRELGKA